jgi:hypothetical protein
MTKIQYLFRVCTIYDIVKANWTIYFSNLEYNYKPASTNSGLLQYQTSVLTQAELDKVSDLNKLGSTPIQILQVLRLANPRLVLVVCNIYNFLYYLQLDKLGARYLLSSFYR